MEMSNQKSLSEDTSTGTKMQIGEGQGIAERTSYNSTTSKTLTGTMEVTIERTRSDTFPRISNLRYVTLISCLMSLN